METSIFSSLFKTSEYSFRIYDVYLKNEWKPNINILLHELRLSGRDICRVKEYNWRVFLQIVREHSPQRQRSLQQYSRRIFRLLPHSEMFHLRSQATKRLLHKATYCREKCKSNDFLNDLSGDDLASLTNCLQIIGAIILLLYQNFSFIKKKNRKVDY